MKIEFYRLIQRAIVPIEAKMVVVILKLVGINSFPTPTSVNIGKMTTIGNSVTISWNCIGWQSFILMVITLITGLQGAYPWGNKIEAIIIGILGTFMINILRVSLIIVVAYKVNRLAAIIIHDYFSTFLTILWLFFFWWFTYSYVLEKINEDQDN